MPEELKVFDAALVHIIGSSCFMLGDFERAAPLLDLAERLGLRVDESDNDHIVNAAGNF